MNTETEPGSPADKQINVRVTESMREFWTQAADAKGIPLICLRHGYLFAREFGSVRLVPTPVGWVCPIQDCDFTQDWAWATWFGGDPEDGLVPA